MSKIADAIARRKADNRRQRRQVGTYVSDAVDLLGIDSELLSEATIVGLMHSMLPTISDRKLLAEATATGIQVLEQYLKGDGRHHGNPIDARPTRPANSAHDIDGTLAPREGDIPVGASTPDSLATAATESPANATINAPATSKATSDVPRSMPSLSGERRSAPGGGANADQSAISRAATTPVARETMVMEDDRVSMTSDPSMEPLVMKAASDKSSPSDTKMDKDATSGGMRTAASSRVVGEVNPSSNRAGNDGAMSTSSSTVKPIVTASTPATAPPPPKVEGGPPPPLESDIETVDKRSAPLGSIPPTVVAST